ncbi:fatty-acid oxidation protein subunit alpha [Spirulina subsalsa FACHB-351]|uniref:Fatty-acid oxidation protein subunit alpha n=1 Tax=Spirulina subsalsa FACHB-351 TaxID=234711 RepID=A0ABT3LAT9_9CYAN|nr:element excision factor XisH family protein [Spirulina subsalsa]MCW6038606.1 fatty-acid oxidation protein subunit alpha [Spirulina subsalsa FACHB-351]
MAAKDLFHEAVKEGLQKEQWQIIADPLLVKIDTVRFEIDLGADRLLVADKGPEKIAIEIKSFIGNSIITDFHAAIGQFINYRTALKLLNSERRLYLAVPIDAFNPFFKERLPQEVIRSYDVNLIVYDPHHLEILQWIN